MEDNQLGCSCHKETKTPEGRKARLQLLASQCTMSVRAVEVGFKNVFFKFRKLKKSQKVRILVFQVSKNLN